MTAQRETQLFSRLCYFTHQLVTLIYRVTDLGLHVHPERGLCAALPALAEMSPNFPINHRPSTTYQVHSQSLYIGLFFYMCPKLQKTTTTTTSDHKVWSPRFEPMTNRCGISRNLHHTTGQPTYAEKRREHIRKRTTFCSYGNGTNGSLELYAERVPSATDQMAA